MNTLESTLGRWVVQRRWWVLAATLLAVSAAAGGMRLLTSNNDTRVFFSEQNPQLQALEDLENTYTKDNSVLFVIAPGGGDVFTRDTLAAVEELTEACWQMPYSTRVDSITNFQHTRADGDELIVEDLATGAESLSDADFERVRRIALSEPLLAGRLVSPSGHVTGVNVTVLLPGESSGEAVEVAAFARRAADEARRGHPGVDVHLTGSVMMDNAFGEVSQADMVTLYPLVLLVLTVLIGLALRSLTGTAATLAVIVASVVTAMGLAGWLGVTLTVASIAAPVLILTLAVADSIHILVTMFHQMRQGKVKSEAIAESLRVNLQPVFLTSTTTAIGFLTMNFSDAPPFRDLGNIVAMGVMAALVFAVLSLPALLAVLPVRVKPSVSADCQQCVQVADFVVRRRNLLFWGMPAVILLLASGILSIELDDDFFTYFDESYEFRRATDFTRENLGGIDTIEYSLESGTPGGINDPRYLATVEKFANWYRQHPNVSHVSSLAEIMKRLNQNMHGDDRDYYLLPESRELAAQYLLLYEMSLPYGLDLNNQINVDKSATRMTVIIEDVRPRTLHRMDAEARHWLAENAPESMFTHGTGLAMIWSYITLRNIRTMLTATLLALLLISGILTLALRSFRLGLLSLIPNLAPFLMAFGVWGLLVGQVGLGLSVVASMTIGIVVDDTVHFLTKYLRARREHAMSPPEAVRYSLHTVGTALIVTTLVLAAGFAVLSFSSYRMNADMGQLTALTILLALALDLLFLPALLMRAARRTAEPARSAAGADADLRPVHGRL